MIDYTRSSCEFIFSSYLDFTDLRFPQHEELKLIFVIK